MASIIRIKRSSVSGNPATLAAGELAYSALADNGANGGDRLYVGMGTESAGNAANHIVIGGRYYTNLVDQGGSGGTLNTSAKSIPVLSATGTIDKWLVGNLQLTGNTLSSTNTNGDITIQPAGTGAVNLYNPYIDQSGTLVTLEEYIQDISGGQIIGGTGITVTYDDGAGTTTIDADPITLGTTVLTNGQTTLGLAGLTSLGVSGNATITGTLALGSDFAINTNKFTVASATGNTAVAGTLSVTGATTLSSTLGVTSNATVGGTLGVTGATTLADTLAVTGATTLSSTLAVTSNTTVGGTLGVTNNFAVNTNKFVVDATTGDTAVGGNLSVTTNATVGGTLGVSSNASIGGTLGVTGNTTIGGTLGVTGAASFSDGLDMNNTKITGLAEPTADSDAATKYYVDAARSGLDIKNSVKAATTGAITLSNTQTIDGIALSVGDRVLVKNQADASQNGIYVVASGTWARAADADQPAELNPGTFVFVEQGTVNDNTGFVVVSDSVLTIGTDAIDWTLFSTSGTLIAGNGLSKNGYTLEVNVANGIEISSDNVQLASTVAGAGLTYTSGVLDVVGTADRITVNANNIDIASTYVGQTSITTLGTIGTGTWQGDVIADAYIADNLTISGGTINNTPIGQTTAAAGSFTTLTASSTLAVTGATTLSSTLAVTSNTTIGGTLGVTGNVTLSANLTGAGAATSNLDGFNIDGGTY